MLASSHFSRAVDFIKEGLAPCCCAGCGKYGPWVCAECASKIVWVLEQRCYRCGVLSEAGRVCANCRRHSNLTSLLVACHYEEGPIRSAVHQFKYEGAVELAAPFARGLAAALPNYISRGWVVVPVPAHRKRTLGRGYNPSELLARAVARIRGLEFDGRVLEKYRYTAPQVESGRLERLGKVSYSMRVTSKLHDRRVILVDDVATTGATLEEAARALREAGAKRVVGLVIARSHV